MAKSPCNAHAAGPERSAAPDCRHDYGDAPVVFTGTVRARACRKCDRIEVLVERTGAWVDIDAYVQRRLANRSSTP